MALTHLKSWLVRIFLQYWSRRNARRYDIGNTIVVASSPRGGSTWLAEIIATLPGYPILWEPLHPGTHPECQEFGFDWHSANVPLHAKQHLQLQYLNDVLDGTRFSSLISYLHWRDSLKQILRFCGFLVKFTRANLLLYWMLQHFPVRTILMIRHPCAVVSSQLLHPAWDMVNKKTLVLPQRLILDHPHLADVHQTIITREEVLAFRWAIETYVPLMQPQPHPWYLTTYECLVEESKMELERVFRFLGYSVPSKAYEQLHKPSASTKRDSDIATGRNPLTGWKDRLASHQIDTILSVVHQVGIDFYSDALGVDYEKLFEMGSQAK